MTEPIQILINHSEILTDWLIAIAALGSMVGFLVIGIIICCILNGIRRRLK